MHEMDFLNKYISLHFYEIIAMAKKLQADYVNQLQDWKIPRLISERRVEYVKGERNTLKVTGFR